MTHQRIEVPADVDEITIVRTTSEPKAAPVTQQSQPQQRSGGKRGPRKQGKDESDADHAARVERYNNKHAATPAATPAASLPTREASDKPKRQAFTTTLCKCRGDKQTAKKQGTYGQPGFVPAKYEPTNDFNGFGIGIVNIPAGHALCGTFLRKDVKPRKPAKGQKQGEQYKSNEVFDGAIYHTGHGSQKGWWVQILLFDEVTSETRPMTGRPLLKFNSEIVELYFLPCLHCKAS